MSQEELDNLISVCWHDSQYKGGYNKKSLRCCFQLLDTIVQYLRVYSVL